MCSWKKYAASIDRHNRSRCPGWDYITRYFGSLKRKTGIVAMHNLFFLKVFFFSWAKFLSRGEKVEWIRFSLRVYVSRQVLDGNITPPIITVIAWKSLINFWIPVMRIYVFLLQTFTPSYAKIALFRGVRVASACFEIFAPELST